jgi:hypothetical protein
MHAIRNCLALAIVVALCGVPALAQQANQNVRGTISAFDGKVLAIKTSAGSMAMVEVPESARISTTAPFGKADIKPGMTLGVTTVQRADGAIVAIDVRPIPPAARLGLSPYDLAPQSTMTNAKLEGVVAGATGDALALDYGSGKVNVLLTDQTAMSRAVAGSLDDLKTGETVYVFANRGEDGKLAAVRVQVSKDGVKPTQ